MPNLMMNNWQPGMHSAMAPEELVPGAVTDLINCLIMPGKGICTYNPVYGKLNSGLGRLLAWQKFGDDIWFITDNELQQSPTVNALQYVYRYNTSGAIERVSTFVAGDIQRNMKSVYWQMHTNGDYLVFVSGTSHCRDTESKTANWYIKRKVYAGGFAFTAYDGSLTQEIDIDTSGISIELIPYLETAYNDMAIEDGYKDIVSSMPMSASLPAGSSINVMLAAVDTDGREYVLKQKTFDMNVSEEADPVIGSGRAIKIVIPPTCRFLPQCNKIRYYRTTPGASQYIMIAEWPIPKASPEAFFEMSLVGRSRTWFPGDKPSLAGLPGHIKPGVNIFHGESPVFQGGCPTVCGMFNPIVTWPETLAPGKYSQWRMTRTFSGVQNGMYDQSGPAEDSVLPTDKYPMSGIVPIVAWYPYPTINNEWEYSSSTDPNYCENPFGIGIVGRKAMASSIPYKRGMYKEIGKTWIWWLGSANAHSSMVWTGKIASIVSTNIGGMLTVSPKDLNQYSTSTNAIQFEFNHSIYTQEDPPSLDYAGKIESGGDHVGFVVDIVDEGRQIQIPIRQSGVVNFGEPNPFATTLTPSSSIYMWSVQYNQLVPFPDQGHAICTFGRLVDSWFNFWRHSAQTRPYTPQLVTHKILVGMNAGAAFDAGTSDKFYFGITPTTVEDTLSTLTIYRCKSDMLEASYFSPNTSEPYGAFQACTVEHVEVATADGTPIYMWLHGINQESVNAKFVVSYQTHRAAGSTMLLKVRVVPFGVSVPGTPINASHSGTVSVTLNGARTGVTATANIYPDVSYTGTYTVAVTILNAARVYDRLALGIAFSGLTLNVNRTITYEANGVPYVFEISDMIGLGDFRGTYRDGDNSSLDESNQRFYGELDRTGWMTELQYAMHGNDEELKISGPRLLFHVQSYNRERDFNNTCIGLGLPSSLPSYKTTATIQASVSGQLDVNAALNTGNHRRSYRESVPPTNFSIEMRNFARSLPEILGLVGTDFKLVTQTGIEIGTFPVMSVSYSLDGLTAWVSSYCSTSFQDLLADETWYILKFYQENDRTIFVIDDLFDEPMGNEWNEYNEFSDISYGLFTTMNGLKYYGNVVSEIGSSESSSSFIYYSDSNIMRASGTFDRIDVGAPLIAMIGGDGVLWAFTSTGVIGYIRAEDGKHYPVIEHYGRTVTGQNCIIKYDDKIYFITSDGLYSIGRDGVVELSYTNSEKFSRWVASVGSRSIVIGVDANNSILLINTIEKISTTYGGAIHGWALDVKTGSMFQHMFGMGMDIIGKVYVPPIITLGGINNDIQTPANGLISPFYIGKYCCAIVSNKNATTRGFYYTAEVGDTGVSIIALDSAYAIRQAVPFDQDSLIKVLRSYAMKIPYRSNHAVSIYVISDMYPSEPVSVSSSQTGIIHDLLADRMHFRTITCAIKANLPNGLNPAVEFITFDWEPVGSGSVGQARIDTSTRFSW